MGAPVRFLRRRGLGGAFLTVEKEGRQVISGRSRTGLLLKLKLLPNQAAAKIARFPAQSPEALKMVAGLKDIAQRAVLAETHEDSKQRSTVGAIHRLYAPVLLGEKLHRAKLTVIGYRVGRKNLHALEEIEMDGPGAITLLPASASASSATQRPQGPSTISIAQLLEGATRQDGTPLLPERTPPAESNPDDIYFAAVKDDREPEQGELFDVDAVVEEGLKYIGSQNVLRMDWDSFEDGKAVLQGLGELFHDSREAVQRQRRGVQTWNETRALAQAKALGITPKMLARIAPGL